MKIHKMLTDNPFAIGARRDCKKVKYIVIHYTGNKDDTAKGNCNYFKNGKLTRFAGAHFFVDDTSVWKSVPMSFVAYAVGAASADKSEGGGSLWKVCTNENSVSIELCDCMNCASANQIELTRRLIKRIRRKCPNAEVVCRHWDVTGKKCPGPYAGKDNKLWPILLNAISK